MPTFKLGTRGSELALFQANAVAALLQQHASVLCDIVIIKTSGDRLAEAPLSEIGGKRLFVKEIEEALLAGTIDLAVHSSKDMPAVQPDGLVIGAVLPREDPHDALILPAGRTEVPPAPRIGTSSVRRIAQLRRMFPGATFTPIRGNLGTRLRKLDAGDYDALVLAAAGLRRLQQGARISSLLPADACVPAPGQGIIAVEIRADAPAVAAAVARINDPAAAAALAAERAVVTRLGGGCQMPIGAHARIEGQQVRIDAVVISLDGNRVARADASGTTADPGSVGRQAAELLLQRGAGEILAEVERANAKVEGIQP